MSEEYVNKSELFSQIAEQLKVQGFIIDHIDQTRPWGGFFVIAEEQAQQFANTYFDGMDIQNLKIAGKLSHKVLVVAPEKRLCWQYQHSRAQIWRVTQGEIGIITSAKDEQNELKKLKEGDIIRLSQGERHRLIGLKTYGVVAEIWQHTDADNPSDETDIVRVEDDFGR